MDKESKQMFMLILDKLDNIDTRLDTMDKRFDKIETRLDAVEERLDAMDVRFDTMDARFDKIENHLAILGYKQERTDKKLKDMHLDMQIFERDIRNDIHVLQDKTETILVVLKQNDMISA